MSVGYTWVQWNRKKLIYDALIVSTMVLYIVTFFLVSKLRWAGNHAISDEVLIIRAAGTLAFLMLHVILCIGPLARIDVRFAPLLYNRRHLGVATFFVGLLHGLVSTGYYYAFGTINPITALLTMNTRYASISEFPFEMLGLAALGILFVMAVTSHDFWNHTLGPAVWKALHMLVYIAYALLVGHVALGALQHETHGGYIVVLAVGVMTVGGLHIIAGVLERKRDAARRRAEHAGWFDACSVDDIADNSGVAVCPPSGERIAVFRYDGKLSAVSDVCKHQAGPLSEGRIIDGCITCPWHGWQYRPGDGQSPPPFQERIATYPVRIDGRRIMVSATALPEGTPVAPATCPQDAAAPAAESDPLFVNYFPTPARHRHFAWRIVPTIMLACTALAGGVAAMQSDPGEGTWHIHEPLTLTGAVANEPYPVIIVDEPGGMHSVLLVGPTKSLPDDIAMQPALRPGEVITVEGTMLTRSGVRMLAVEQVHRATSPAGTAPMLRLLPATRDLGDVSLQGEIVDPKCSLGAMKPGEGKTHKGCATLCIAGGIPPMLATQSALGARRYYLLETHDGQTANDMVLPLIAEPVIVGGRAEHRGDLYVLTIAPNGITRP